MKLPLPDNGQEVKQGDTHFILHGIYHGIQWISGEPYRPRVEMLAIKDNRQVFLCMYDEPKEYGYKYRLPGGSLDADSDRSTQAMNETNEEALLAVDNVYFSGVQYTRDYEEGFLLKGGDICIAYKGEVTDVFTSKYIGKYDKKSIDKDDLDNDMAKNGKFYYITSVMNDMRPEHLEALLQSPEVADDIKRHIRLRTSVTEANVRRVSEAATESQTPSKKPVYIVCCGYSTPFSNMVKAHTKSQYNHCALALDDTLDVMYTFRHNHFENGKYSGGFEIESLRYIKRLDDDAIIKVNVVMLDNDKFENLQKNIQNLIVNMRDTKYDTANLLRTFLNIEMDNSKVKDDTLTCSEFVTKVLYTQGVKLSDKPINLTTPDDVANSDIAYHSIRLYIGSAKKYKPSKLSPLPTTEAFTLETIEHHKVSYVYHGSPNKIVGKIRPHASTHNRSYVYASPNYNFALCFAGKWNDFIINQSCVDGKIILTEIKEGAFNQVYNKPGYIYTLRWDSFFAKTKDDEGTMLEVVSTSPVPIINVEYIPNILDKLKNSDDVELYKYPKLPSFIMDRNQYIVDRTRVLYKQTGDASIITYVDELYPELHIDDVVICGGQHTATITEAKRSQLPSDVFGIPEHRKYPLDTKKHVLSAIKLFNHVEPQYEKQLAKRIKQAIKEFGITGNEIHITDKNRFSKYYKKPNTNSVEVVVEYSMSKDKLLDKIDKLVKAKNTDVANFGREAKLALLHGFDNTTDLFMTFNTVLFGGGLALALCIPVMVSLLVIISASIPHATIMTILKKQKALIASNLDKLDRNGKTYNGVLTSMITSEGDIKPVEETYTIVLEAPGDVDTDEEQSEDYTEQVTDDDTGDPLDGDVEEPEEEESTDYTEDVEEPDDEDLGDDTEDTGEAPEEEESTDYTDEVDDTGEGGLSDYDPETTDDTGEEMSDTDETVEDNDTNKNTIIKNYNLMVDFQKMFRAISDILVSLDPVIYTQPIQNSVLAQVIKNLQTIKDCVVRYIDINYSTKYEENLYYYGIFLQSLKFNLEILRKNDELADDN